MNIYVSITFTLILYQFNSLAKFKQTIALKHKLFVIVLLHDQILFKFVVQFLEHQYDKMRTATKKINRKIKMQKHIQFQILKQKITVTGRHNNFYECDYVCWFWSGFKVVVVVLLLRFFFGASLCLSKTILNEGLKIFDDKWFSCKNVSHKNMLHTFIHLLP